MKLIYGTTNSAKLETMKKHLSSLELTLCGLDDIKCDLPEIDESGNSPLENAKIKALAYYSVLKTPVFSCDSGLYIEGAPDCLQPGVHVRTVNGKRLNDDEMINYYSSLADSMGGAMFARYKNAVCLVMNENEVYEYMDNDIAGERFIISGKPHQKRVAGFPIDSLSVHIETGKYYYDLEGNQDKSFIDQGFRKFFERSLKLSDRISVDFKDVENIPYKYVVIAARYNNQWVFVRHKNRETYEIPGGHIDDGEDYTAAAKRELFEETGAVDFSLDFVSVYTVTRNGFTDGGYLFFADIKSLAPLPDYEMAELRLFDRLPNELTYPLIQPDLFRYIQGWLNIQSGKGEPWDVYDTDRNLTGRIHLRGNQLLPGDYHLVVHVWLMNSSNEFLITKRTPNKGYPNMWESTGGSAVSGDSSLDAAIREVKEETGLDVLPQNGQCLFTLRGDNDFSDIWLFKQDFNLNDVVLQENETCGVKYASQAEIKAMIAAGEFIAFEYIDRLFEMI